MKGQINPNCDVTVSAQQSLYGRVRVPGDKSMTHRAILFGLLADGRTSVRGWLDAEDCRSSIRVARLLGANVEEADGILSIDGTKGLLMEPDDVLDCGNSGTTMRLFIGAIAASVRFACLSGDASLRRRPMKRVFDPLHQMGATFHARDQRFAPFCVLGQPLQGIEYTLPVASAQVKSAVLIAGMLGNGVTTVIESTPTRDHTESMLSAFGVHVEVEHLARGRRISVEGGQKLKGVNMDIPGDISSAAFLLAAGALVEGSEVTVEQVGLNPTRTGFLHALSRMGAEVSITNQRQSGGEWVGDVTVRATHLRAVTISPEEVPSMIDELPLIGVLAAFAEGESVVRGASELRLKESDRITTLVAGLRALGVDADEFNDGFVIRGGNQAVTGIVESANDHRMAMSFAIAGLTSKSGVTIRDWQAVAISYPSFAATLRELGADVSDGANH